MAVAAWKSMNFGRLGENFRPREEGIRHANDRRALEYLKVNGPKLYGRNAGKMAADESRLFQTNVSRFKR